MTRFLRDLRALGLDDAAALVALFLGGALFTTILAIMQHGGAQ